MEYERFELEEMGIKEQSPREEMEWLQRTLRHLSNNEYTLSKELVDWLYERRSELLEANNFVVEWQTKNGFENS